MDAQHEVQHPIEHLQAVGETLKQICHMGKFEYGEAWYPVRSRKYGVVLECYPVFFSERDPPERFAKFRRLTESICLPENMGLAGRVAQSKEPEWFENVCALPPSTFLRLEVAEELTMKTAVAVPAFANSQLKIVFILWNFGNRREESGIIEKAVDIINNVYFTSGGYKASQHLLNSAPKTPAGPQTPSASTTPQPTTVPTTSAALVAPATPTGASTTILAGSDDLLSLPSLKSLDLIASQSGTGLPQGLAGLTAAAAMQHSSPQATGKHAGTPLSDERPSKTRKN